MIHEKTMGEYCGYLNKYVPIRIKYLPDSSALKSCENSTCGNKDCNLCDSFTGDRSKGKNFLGQPHQDIE